MAGVNSSNLLQRLFKRNPAAFVDALLQPHVLHPLLEYTEVLCDEDDDDDDADDDDIVDDHDGDDDDVDDVDEDEDEDNASGGDKLGDDDDKGRAKLRFGAAMECYEECKSCVSSMRSAAEAAESTWVVGIKDKPHAVLKALFKEWLPQLHCCAGVSCAALQVASTAKRSMPTPPEFDFKFDSRDNGARCIEVGKGQAVFIDDTSDVDAIVVSNGGIAIVIDAKALQYVCISGKGSYAMLIGCEVSNFGLNITHQAMCVLLGCVVHKSIGFGCHVADNSSLTSVGTVFKSCFVSCCSILGGSSGVMVASLVGLNGKGMSVAAGGLLEGNHLEVMQEKGCMAGISLCGAASKASLSRCHIHDNTIHGICVNGGATLELHDCIVQRNGGCGVAAEGCVGKDFSSATMWNSNVSGNRIGVQSENGAVIETRHCETSLNSVAGVKMTAARAVCHFHKARHNQKYGISAANGGEVTMHFGLIECNGSDGVHVEGDGTDVHLLQTQILCNAGSGVFVRSGELHAKCRMSRNGRHGVEVRGKDAEAMCERCVCSHNKGCGFFVGDGGELVVTDGCISKRNQGYGLTSAGRGSTAFVYNLFSYDKQGRVSRQDNGFVSPFTEMLFKVRSVIGSCKLQNKKVEINFAGQMFIFYVSPLQLCRQTEHRVLNFVRVMSSLCRTAQIRHLLRPFVDDLWLLTRTTRDAHTYLNAAVKLPDVAMQQPHEVAAVDVAGLNKR